MGNPGKDRRGKGKVNSPSSEDRTLLFSAFGNHHFKCSGLWSGLSYTIGYPGSPFFEFKSNYTTGLHVRWLTGDTWNISTSIIL